jgi:CRISPR-associated endonuclease/helicase Cas3
VWLVNERGQVTIINLVALLSEDKKQVVERLAESTILLPPTLGGLRKGMLDGKGKKAEDVADEWNENDQRRRLRLWDKHEPPSGMALVRIIDVNPNAEEDALANTEDESDDPSKQRRFWHWYVRPKDAEDATPASQEPVSWQDHTKDVEQHAEQIVDELDLPEDLRQAVVLAAELHDLGKQRELWQRSIGNPKPTEWYAKSGKPKGEPRWRPQHISDYRHEFGSLLDVLNQNSAYASRLADLDQDMQDIVLHLIAAHHGYGRPHFPPPATVDPDYPQTTADDTAIEIMRRYARLQRRYGRWGLAYLESLLRAADWAASAKPKITNCSKEVSV